MTTRLEDEAEIRKLVARFADAATRADKAAFAATWAPDARFEIKEPLASSARGSAAIMTMFSKLRDDKLFFVQFVHSGVIDVDADRATARWITHEVGRGHGEVYYRNYGIFADKLQKVDGQWLFAERVYHYIY